MTEIEIEIMRTVTTTREESAVVRVNVPQEVLDGPDGDSALWDWAEDQLKNNSGELVKAVEGQWEVYDTDESFEIDEVNRTYED